MEGFDVMQETHMVGGKFAGVICASPPAREVDEAAFKVAEATVDSSDDDQGLEVGKSFGSLQDSCELAKGRRLKDTEAKATFALETTLRSCAD